MQRRVGPPEPAHVSGAHGPANRYSRNTHACRPARRQLTYCCRPPSSASVFAELDLKRAIFSGWVSSFVSATGCRYFVFLCLHCFFYFPKWGFSSKVGYLYWYYLISHVWDKIKYFLILSYIHSAIDCSSIPGGITSPIPLKGCNYPLWQKSRQHGCIHSGQTCRHAEPSAIGLMCEQSILNPSVKAESLRVNFANGWMTEPAATCSPATTTSPPAESYHPCSEPTLSGHRRNWHVWLCTLEGCNWCNLLKYNVCTFNTQGSPENSHYSFRNLCYMFFVSLHHLAMVSYVINFSIYMVNVTGKTKQHPVETLEFKAAECLALVFILTGRWKPQNRTS